MALHGATTAVLLLESRRPRSMMSTPHRRPAVPKRTLGLCSVLVLSAIGLDSTAQAAPEAPPAAPPPVVASSTDTGVIDITQSGKADYSSYGERNRGLSAGEQGADGWELRYVAPFALPPTTAEAVGRGGGATLSFRVWRTAELDGRELVVTALPGDRTGTDDFDRDGIEVHRSEPTVGVVELDVSDAVRELGTPTITFRFATGQPPTAGDHRFGQINIATADGREENRPTLRFTPPPPVVEAAAASPPSSAPVTSAAATPTATAPTRADAPPTSAPATSGGMPLVFSDEFDGTRLNTSVWRPYHSTYGDGNRELQCHTPNNVAVSGGTLKITARRQSVTCPDGSQRRFSSGFLGTRETGTYFPRYGRYEMRARLPHGQGLWPAFWLRHRNGSGVAEVDIMEYFHSQIPGHTTGTLHLDGRLNLSKDVAPFEQPTRSPGWHTWAVDIAPVANGVKFTFSLNGRDYHSYVDTQRRWDRNHGGRNLWDIALNLSVGGNWVGDPDGHLGYLNDLSICAQGGSGARSCEVDGIRRADFPSTYEVDYVRVYGRN